jgi:hypothetical protein
MNQFRHQPAPSASYPPPEHLGSYENGASENVTVNIPPLPQMMKSPSSAHVMSSPSRRRTLGSPSRQLKLAVSPVKSHANLRAQAAMDGVVRKQTSIGLRSDRASAMVKLAARNTFRGRESEATDWDKECERNEKTEMPSPFIRRKSRISGVF